MNSKRQFNSDSPGRESGEYTLEQVIATVTLELRQWGFEHLPDRRTSLFPDIRMVRYYTTLGLLPAPQVIKRQAVYRLLHIDTLLLVKLLQLKGLSLGRIQEELLVLSPQQKYRWLEELKKQLTQEFESPTKPLASSTWQEVTLEPGLRLHIREGYQCKDPGALLRQIQSLLNQNVISN